MITSAFFRPIGLISASAAALVVLLPGLATAEPATRLTTSGGDTLVVSASILKSVPSSANEGWIAYDFVGDRVTLVDASNRRAVVGRFFDYCTAIHTLILGGVRPPAVPKPVVAVAPEGDGGTIAGQSTLKYAVTVNGRPYQEVWVAVGVPSSLSLASVASVKLATCSSQTGPEGAPEMDPSYQAMAGRGLIVETVSKAGGQSDIRDQITGISSTELTPQDLAIPPSWPQIDFAQFLKTH